jgi:hypothetical protein
MIVPSRGRPQNVAALLTSWAETANGSADLAIVLDEDDPARPEYFSQLDKDVVAAVLPRWVVMTRRLRLGGTLNEVALTHGRDYQMVGFLGDDHRPRSLGWDARLVAALRELGTGMVYGDDLFQRQNLPTQIAMTSDIVQALGYMVPGGLVHLYIDNAWAELGNAIGRLRYLPDVVIEHLHPSAGKAAMDASYEETNSQQQFDADKHRFEDWKRFSLDADVAKLRELIRRG